MRLAGLLAGALLLFLSPDLEAAEPPSDAQPPSFVNDVIPLLTRLGCNQGACHGKLAGQNGFKLSLRGYAPELDYPGLTREFSGRRINHSDPAVSLLLQKPLGIVPHEGGKLMDAGSREHRLLLDWLQKGMPGPKSDEPRVQSIALTPGSSLLELNEEKQLKVEATYSDGSKRDVTWLSKFESGDAGTASVDPRGKILMKRSGEAAIRVHFADQVSVVVVTSPFAKAVPADKYAAKNNFIDEHVFKKLAGLQVEPSGLSSDDEFIRRVFLDTLGVLPTPEEVRGFLDDKRADKRARLIDGLLQRPEFVDYWALQLSDLFQNRRERDHDVRGTKGVRAFHEWLRQQVAANRPWDGLARDVLVATGKSSEHPAVGYYIVTVGEKRDPSQSEVVDSVAQAFLGTRVGCARCHNHPLEKYTQDDYYHFAAYFARVKLDRKDPKMGPTTLLVSHHDPKQNDKPIGVTQPRTGKFMAPQPLDRSPTKVAPGEDPRVQLANWMTDGKNEYFSGAMVNRVWRHYLGVGLVEPVDDLRASNPPTNPELWQALNQHFVNSKFDLRGLMRAILNSRTYQLTSQTAGGNEAETRFYSHYYARRLPAEVLLDSLSQSTGVPDQFPGYPVGIRAVQLPDSALKSYFLELFGRSERVTACACERNGEVTMPQLLHLQNGDSVVMKIKAGDGRLAELLKKHSNDADVVDQLFLATLARLPGQAERDTIQKTRGNSKRDDFFRDLFWALLNSKEFCFNH